jgi:predicted nucleic acid-binding Zn finger protein
MNAKKDGDTWEVESESGHTYFVSSSSCTCPHFQHRVKKSGGSCKHMIFISGLESKSNNYEEIVVFIRSNNGATYTQLEKQFGKDIELKLKALERKGEIIYMKWDDTYNILE